jgi:hypothetical protein
MPWYVASHDGPDPVLAAATSSLRSPVVYPSIPAALAQNDLLAAGGHVGPGGTVHADTASVGPAPMQKSSMLIRFQRAG